MVAVALEKQQNQAFSADWYVREMKSAAGADVVALLKEDGQFARLAELYPQGMRVSDMDRLAAARRAIREAPNGEAAVARYCIERGVTGLVSVPGARPQHGKNGRRPVDLLVP